MQLDRTLSDNKLDELRFTDFDIRIYAIVRTTHIHYKYNMHDPYHMTTRAKLVINRENSENTTASERVK